MMKKYYDISISLSNNMPVWEGDPEVKFNKLKVPLNGSDTYVTGLEISTHSGTHIDIPGHFENGHKFLTSDLDLHSLIGNCFVLDSPFELEEIKEVINVFEKDQIRLLFKTNIIENSFDIDYNYKNDILTEKLVKFLIDNNVKIIGVDAPSPENPTNRHFPIHQLLFENNIIIIENLNLTHVQSGLYKMICLPLALKDINDGVPCRVILEEL